MVALGRGCEQPRVVLFCSAGHSAGVLLKFSMCFTMRPAITGVKILEHMLVGMSQQRLGSAVSASRKKQDIPTVQ